MLVQGWLKLKGSKTYGDAGSGVVKNQELENLGWRWFRGSWKSRALKPWVMLLQGWMPVHCATSNRSSVAMLVAFGADINAKSVHVSLC